MDIVSRETIDARLLDAIARAALGKATSGVSTGAGSRIHLLHANPPEQQRASDVLNHFGALNLSASATALTQGAPDPVIRCRDSQIAADDQVGYLVLRAGEESMRGTLTVAQGVCSLVLPKPSAADYIVCLFRLRGNFASGAAEIRVTPA